MNTSKKDIKWVRSLQQKKNRKELSLFVVEGKKLSEEAMASGWKVHAIFSTDHAWATQFNAQTVSANEMAVMSSLATPSGYLAVMQVPKTPALNMQSPCVLVLDGIADPGNLGTLLRTAEWFGIREVLLSNDSVELYNPKVVQATMGSIFRLNCMYADLRTIIQDLKSHHYNIYGTLLNGENLFSAKWSTKTAIVLGSESHGVSEEVKALIDTALTIPGFGSAESLNVAVAGAIAMAEWRRVLSV